MKPTPPKSLMWEPTQATLDIGFGVLCGGKGTAPGCAHCVGAQRYQAKMFQATGLCSHKQRPPIMHAYGGAKTGMAQALQSIASESWLPLAAAMVGTRDKPPLWTDLGLRPVVGTTLDIKLEPCPLERREVALLLSCWKRWDTTSVADSAINTWLKGANPEFGPDCEDSPCYGIRKMGRGMGSPIPSLQEGAWTREGPKFVDGGSAEVR